MGRRMLDGDDDGVAAAGSGGNSGGGGGGGGSDGQRWRGGTRKRKRGRPGNQRAGTAGSGDGEGAES